MGTGLLNSLIYVSKDLRENMASIKQGQDANKGEQFKNKRGGLFKKI